jgi:hypothetical protein
MSENIHTIEELRDVITSIDALSQQGFSQIRSIASLSLQALESPGRSVNTCEDIASALLAIRGISEMIQNDINCESGSVEGAYLDQSMLRRFDARRAAENIFKN